MGDASVASTPWLTWRWRYLVSVPFPWGTLLLPVKDFCGLAEAKGFSPLPMGDASVARIHEGLGCQRIMRFSPLPMGDASVAPGKVPRPQSKCEFQSPSHGGRFCCASGKQTMMQKI